MGQNMVDQASASKSSQFVTGTIKELSLCLDAASSSLLEGVRAAILTDPGLPRANPTISSWQVPEHPTLSSIQSPKLPRCTDFAVIGSGITGCSAAKTLLEHHATQSAHITVFEARTLVSGATGRNGGHLVTAAGHTFGPLARQHGVEAAKQITRFSILNIDCIMKMVKEMGTAVQEECQLRDVLKVMAVENADMWAAAKSSVLDFQENVQEYSNYHRIIEKEDVPSKWNIQNAQGAVEHEAGAIWPYRLLMRLYEIMLEKYPQRLSLEAQTPVTNIEHSPDADSEYPYAITTPRGVVRARRVLHCTNGHASHLLPRLAGGIYPFRGTMSVQKPGPHLANMGASQSWSLAHKSTLNVRTGFYDTGLYYLQQNALTGRIWIGNETAYLKDILTANDTYVPKEAKQALSTVLPNFFLKGWGAEKTSEIEAIWSGIQGHTADGLPIVGHVPASVTGEAGDSEQWIAAGFNGYGMDKCWLTGEALVRMMLDEDVSAWFPQCFLITERRLREELTADKTVLKFAKIALPMGSTL
ncbi:Gamma-glutamylputrescine oxidoreductase [Paramyrothecium foliicola]|nr:Gamma-glutamylputrescine oxidoreductase [Paramyrothecium foliicola]